MFNARTDTLKLNQTAMFAKIRAGLPVERQHTQNLLECKDDMLYAWDSEECCLLAVNWRLAALEGFEAVKYQNLIPSVPQSFQVERVVASSEGSLIALAGARGVTVLELPRRWGKDGLFMEGKEKITCRAFNLDSLLFSNNPHLELRQLRWHPFSPTDSHLLVLLSDNTIRVYDNSTLRHVWKVGPVPMKSDNNLNSSLPTALLLGEFAVDFDIAPAVAPKEDAVLNSSTTINNNTTKDVLNHSRNLSKAFNETVAGNQKNAQNSERIEWPIIVLRENGNIYVLMAGLDSHKPRLQGPLTITPQSNDNYGLESCAILVIPSLPPTLVIAEANGTLHHALFLEAEEADESFNEVDASLIIHPSEYTIHVLETVLLELGLPKDDPKSKTYNCPIHLKRDYINEMRYFAYHNAGLHAITINFISELQRFVESDVDSDISPLSIASNAEYIVCTKIDASERINAVLGFVLLQMPSGVVLLLGSGEVISLKLIIDPKILVETVKIKEETDKSLPKLEAKSELDRMLEPSFVDHIKSMLKRDVTQPILSVDKTSTPNPQECYELLTQAIEVLRTQYLKRHELVRAEITKRVNTIKLRKEQQEHEIADLEKERENIRETAHRLAERFEEISDQQEIITKKCQHLVRQAHTRLPTNPIADKEFAQEVERINKETKALTNSMQKARDTINKQTYHISKYNQTAKKKTFHLPERQEKNIKEILMQIAAEVDSQIRDVKHINQQLGV
ncbi:nuclear pore complex protein Nup88 isoform X1 [Bactrocera dorsalis]|uniref:Nuclear pore complex protein Nup88 isoform X1 n=1 Tax=Bactrocera dorsalis TaxID=27457 RepID=A0ABM3JMH5_BACDO|nr:nuclear pore complex protein Nup88 isoform X1 [Bactrocera dorsalis]